MAKRTRPKRRGASAAKHLVIMAKRPLMGRAKRRLARDIGAVAALRFYRNCLFHTVLRLAQDRRWCVSLAVDPDCSIGESFWPKRVALLAQGRGDLGVRMQRLFAPLPPGPVVVIGSDIPAVRAAHIAEAFKRLGSADAVFGRAPDGGFWLVGLRRVPKKLALFGGVRWSSPHALADTLANLDGRRVAFAATLPDVDTKSDLDQQRDRVERLVASDNLPRRFQV
jgi:uncharacterized protein